MEDQHLSISSAGPTKTYKKGLDCYKKGEFKEAKDCFLPESKRLKKKFDQSLSQGKPDAKITAQLTSALFNLASTELSLEKLQEAEEHLKTAILLQQYIPATENTKSTLKKYQKRLQKVLLHKALSAFYIVRTHPTSLYDWYKSNSASLSEVFEKNFSGLVKKIEDLPQNERYYIVSIGCGFGEEIFTLLNMLGEKNFEKIFYIGIDPILRAPSSADEEEDEFSFDKIKNIYKDTGYKNVIFSSINAYDIPSVKNLLNNNKADLIIFRHPCFMNEKQSGTPSDFPKILSKTVPAIAKESGKTNIFVTTYSKSELTKAVVLLVLGGGKLQDDKFSFQNNEDFQYNFVRRDEESVRKGFKETNHEGAEMYPDQFSFLSSYRPPLTALSKEAESKLQSALSALAHSKGAISKNEVPAPSSTAPTVLTPTAIRQPALKEEKPYDKKKSGCLTLFCAKRGFFAVGAAAIVTATAVATRVILNNSR